MSDLHPTGTRGTYTRGYLPHQDHDALIQMITFRLADALPKPLIASQPADLAALDADLDRGDGSCLLRRPDVAGLVKDALHYFAGDRYDLGPWVVMPNHVHVLIHPRGVALGSILHSWKSFTARRINALVGGCGTVWQREYFDQVVRNRRHLMAAVRYVHENPVSAGLAERGEDWELSSARDPAYVEALVGGR